VEHPDHPVRAFMPYRQWYSDQSFSARFLSLAEGIDVGSLASRVFSSPGRALKATAKATRLIRREVGVVAAFVQVPGNANRMASPTTTATTRPTTKPRCASWLISMISPAANDDFVACRRVIVAGSCSPRDEPRGASIPRPAGGGFGFNGLGQRLRSFPRRSRGPR
jgi:hypothetical protein